MPVRLVADGAPTLENQRYERVKTSCYFDGTGWQVTTELDLTTLPYLRLTLQTLLS